MNKIKVQAVVRSDLLFLSLMRDQWIKSSFLKYVLYYLLFPNWQSNKNERYFCCFNHFVNYSGQITM